MRLIEHTPIGMTETLRTDAARRQRLANWLYSEIHHANANHQFLDTLWEENERIYACLPRTATKDTPYVNASNHESTIAAEKTDDIYSQILSAITAVSPLVTARATNKDFVRAAKAVQRRIDLGSNSTLWNVMPALRDSLKDFLKRGTCVWSIDWIQEIKKTKYSRVINAGPRISAIPIEHVCVPSGSCSSIQDLPWIGIFYEYTMSQLTEKAERLGWDISTVKTPRMEHRVSRYHKRITLQQDNPAQESDKYGVYKIYCWFDYDNDGEEEQLLVYFNYDAEAILWLDYAPYDHTPLARAVYDPNEFLFFGRGVVETLSALNGVASDVFNGWIDNGKLCNTRMFKSKPNTFHSDTVIVWPGRNVETTDPASLDTIQLADIYPSWTNLFELVDQLSERRVGIPSIPGTTQALGNRTPGVTALTIMQNLSQRHAAAFHSLRDGLADALRQCLYREQEQLLLGNLELESYLIELLGRKDAALYIRTLTNDRFDDAIHVELTASSASINKQADRQDAIMVANLALQFLPGMLQILTSIADPMAPEPLRNAIIKVIISLSEIFDNVIRTFDHIRNPEIIAIDTTQEASQLSQMVDLHQQFQSLMLQTGVTQGLNGTQPSAQGEPGTVQQGDINSGPLARTSQEPPAGA